MLLNLFQIAVTQGVFFIIVIITLIFAFLAEFVMLKLGLILAKAEDRTNFKWVVVSFFLQIFVIAFVVAPIFFFQIAGGYVGISPSTIIIMLIIGIIVDINFVNMFHKTGLARAVIVFIMLIIPIFIFGSAIGFLFSRL